MYDVMAHAGIGIALWIVGLHVFDVVHWVLHLMMRSRWRALRMLALPHVMHHRWLDGSLTTRWEYQRRNVWGHLVLEFGTQLLFSLVLLGVVPWGAVAVCVLLQSLAFAYLLSQQGLDVNHRPVAVLDAYQPSLIVLPAYHALHHVHPDAYFSAYSKLVDYAVGGGTHLRGKRVALVGAETPFGRALGAGLRRAGAARVAALSAPDDTVLSETDVLVLCAPGVDRCRFVEAHVAATRTRQLPPEVWAVQGGAADPLARHYYRDVRVSYRAIVADAGTLGDAGHASRAAARALVRIRRGFNFVPCAGSVRGLVDFLRFRATAPMPPADVAIVSRRADLARAA